MHHVAKRDRRNLNKLYVLDPAGKVDTRLGKAAAMFRHVGVSETNTLALIRGGLRFFDFCWHRMQTSALPFSPFDPEDKVRLLFTAALQRLEAITTSKSSDPDIVHVGGSDSVLGIVKDMIPGTAAFYEAMIRNQHYSFANPIILPESRRQLCFVPMPGGGRGERRVLTKYFFRSAGVERPAPRTDDPSLVDKVIEAVEGFIRFPKALIMLLKLAIWGLARLRELTKLRVWDWWKASEFGELIDCSNKGRDEEDAKQLLITSDLVDEFTAWFNADRKPLDRHGRSLDEWREFLRDETKTMAQRMREAKETPLFPNARKGFHSPSGVRDVWYRPAMKAAGLPTRFHYLRHAGINDFIDFVNAMEIDEGERERLKLEFGSHLGWAWPERMMAWYSEPTRRQREIRVASLHQQDRRANLKRIADGHIPPRRRDHTSVAQSKRDSRLKALLGFKRGRSRAAADTRRQAA